MLASEARYVMSEMTAKAGKSCLLRPVSVRLFTSCEQHLFRGKRSLFFFPPDKRRTDHRLDGNSQTGGTFYQTPNDFQNLKNKRATLSCSHDLQVCELSKRKSTRCLTVKLKSPSVKLRRHEMKRY